MPLDLPLPSASSDSQPYSLTAEQAVLGAIISDPSCFSAAAIVVRPDDFYLPLHKEIFSALSALDASQSGRFDALVVLDYLIKNGVTTEQDGKQYIFDLVSSVPTTSNVEKYARIVRDKAYIRALIDYANETIEEARDGSHASDVLLNSAEQRLYEIRKGQTIKGPERLSDILPVVYSSLTELVGEDAAEHKGLPTGFPDLDASINGLNRSDLVIIGARPAMGKTSFVLNMARNLCVLSGKRAVVFSLEMSKEQLAQRILSTEARIESSKMRSGRLSKEDWRNMSGAIQYLAGCDLWLDDTSDITVPEMKARVRRLGNVSCVFIDYLQLMTGAKKTDNRTQEVAEITRSLKLMAKDLQIPVITCAQLSRGTEERGRSHRPQLSDLRESGTIEQDADIVMMLYRRDYYKEQDAENARKGGKNSSEEEEDRPAGIPADINETQLLIQKNRHGPTGTIHLVFNSEYTLFTCIEREKSA
ncbi:MAG: replicative DNA helicase [Clostridia bacterium]|nr:replicative DNA helicase [Clostridia bacterium]